MDQNSPARPSNLGLTSRYFAPNPHREPQAVFVRTEKFRSAVSEVKLRLGSDRKPKLFVPADYGAGKTALLRYIEAQTQDQAIVAFTECPPLNRRSTFEKVLGAVLRALTREAVFGLLRQAQQAAASAAGKGRGAGAGRKSASTFTDITGMESELGDFLLYCLESGHETTAWRFLCGEKLSLTELKAARGTRQVIELDQITSFVNALARLCETYEHKTLLIIIDEFERTRTLLGEAKIVFKEALRALVDESCAAGIVVAASVTATEELPSVVADDAVARRLSPYHITPYTADELLRLAKEVIRYRRDGTAVPDKLKTKENVDAAVYPFTREAIDLAIQTIKGMRGEGRMRPADILDVMDRALLIALEGECDVIDAGAVRQACEALKPMLWRV